MAIDVYLKLDEAPGESTDSKHANWIECLAVNFEVIQPRSATASSAGGHTAERCEHKDIVISKLTDMATPKLLQLCSMGKTIPKATIEFMRADGAGVPIKYFTIALTNLLVSGVAPSVSEGNIMTETLSLKYATVKWTYTKQDIKGGSKGSTDGGWDLSANKVM
jgi:type VI secretion system secreted protein Hcp